MKPQFVHFGRNPERLGFHSLNNKGYRVWEFGLYGSKFRAHAKSVAEEWRNEQTQGEHMLQKICAYIARDDEGEYIAHLANHRGSINAYAFEQVSEGDET